MLIFALDLGQRCGFAASTVGDSPRSGAVRLKKPGEHRAVALGNLVAWLNEEWSRERPTLVVKEAPLPLQAYRDRGNSEAAVLMAYGLHGVVEAMAARFGLRLEQAHPATIRKHFIGKGRMGARKDTKAAVVQRAQLLGFMPKDCFDDDRADAIALYDWAAATHGGRAAKVLHLFGEVA